MECVDLYLSRRGERVFRTLFSASRAKTSDPLLVSEAHKEPVVGRFGEQPRAQRFTIHTPLRYRATGGEWQEATMVNISESGVLFQTDQQALSTHEIEMGFSLPTGVAGEAAAQVECRGVIARTVPLTGGAKHTSIAARITKFQFVRANAAGVKEV